jgi:hypothetical protein
VPRIELIWPDGSITTGDTFAEVEAAVRASQWHTYERRRDFRRELRRRAEVYTGQRVPPRPPFTAKAFLESLAAVDFFVLHVNQEQS